MTSGGDQKMAPVGLSTEFGFVGWVSRCVYLMSFAVWDGAEDRKGKVWGL